jgi:hypothetical protein
MYLARPCVIQCFFGMVVAPKSAHATTIVFDYKLFAVRPPLGHETVRIEATPRYQEDKKVALYIAAIVHGLIATAKTSSKQPGAANSSHCSDRQQIPHKFTQNS